MDDILSFDFYDILVVYKMHKPQASVHAGAWTTYNIQSVGTGDLNWYCFSNILLFTVLSVVGVARHIDWFGPGGDRIEPNKPDITVARNDESSSTLTLYKAGTGNAGTYKCVATNGDQQGEATVKVKIFRKYIPQPTPSPNYWVVQTQKKRKKILFIELIVFYWLLNGNTLLFSFSSEDGFFISSINGRKTIRGLLNDPVCCAVLVSNGFYFPWMPSISKCPSEMKSFPKHNFSCYFISYFGLLLEVVTHVETAYWNQYTVAK